MVCPLTRRSNRGLFSPLDTHTFVTEPLKRLLYRFRIVSIVVVFLWVAFYFFARAILPVFWREDAGLELAATSITFIFKGRP